MKKEGFPSALRTKKEHPISVPSGLEGSRAASVKIFRVKYRIVPSCTLFGWRWWIGSPVSASTRGVTSGAVVRESDARLTMCCGLPSVEGTGGEKLRRFGQSAPASRVPASIFSMTPPAQRHRPPLGLPLTSHPARRAPRLNYTRKLWPKMGFARLLYYCCDYPYYTIETPSRLPQIGFSSSKLPTAQSRNRTSPARPAADC
ncbi:hypothetical protein V8F20_008334 [Naviculisporaceae sp. PSN 640]